MARTIRVAVSQRRLQAGRNICAALLLLLLAVGARRVDAAGFREIVSPVMTQADAKASCVAQGGLLAKISASNLQEVSELISRGSFTIPEDWYYRHAAWIGAEDRATEGKYLWQDGSAAADAPWDRGEPESDWHGKHHGLQEDCVILANWRNPWLFGWKMSDWRCEEMLPFVCQIDSLDANEIAAVASKEAKNASQVAKTEEERLAGGVMVGVFVVHPAS
jgi:hypothetical protein